MEKKKKKVEKTKEEKFLSNEELAQAYGFPEPEDDWVVLCEDRRGVILLNQMNNTIYSIERSIQDGTMYLKWLNKPQGQ